LTRRTSQQASPHCGRGSEVMTGGIGGYEEQEREHFFSSIKSMSYTPPPVHLGEQGAAHLGEQG